MKNLMMSIFTVVLGICCLCIVCAISGRNARQMELAANLGNAAESVAAHAGEQAGEGMSRREFLAEAMEKFVMTLRTDSTVEVRIWGADENKGLLGMEGTEIFRYPDGKEGRAAYSRTVIFDRENGEDGFHTVKFYRNRADLETDTDCYKIFVVKDKEKVAEPAEPVIEGMEFEGWRDANDYIADFSQTVEDDIAYYGAWSGQE